MKTMKANKKFITHLLSFILFSLYLKLLEKERKKFEKEVQKLPLQEREEVMELTTSWKEEGIQIGLQRGLHRETELVLQQIKKRFGILQKSIENQIKTLPIDKVEELGISLFDFKDITDLQIRLNQLLSKK